MLGDLLNKALSGQRPLCRAFLAASRWVTRTGGYARWRARTSDAFPLGYVLVASPTPAPSEGK